MNIGKEGAADFDIPGVLAVDLYNFYYNYDTYDYLDAYDYDSFFQTVASLSDGDTIGIEESLKEILVEEPENLEARDLLNRVENMKDKGLFEF